MATISERARSDNTTAFQVVIRVKNMAKVVRTFPTKAKAEEFVAATEPQLQKAAQKVATRTVKERKEKPLYSDFANELLFDTLTLFSQSAFCTKRDRQTLPTILNNVGQVKNFEARPFWVKTYVEKMRNKTTLRGTYFAYATLKVHLNLMRRASLWRAEELDLDPPQLHFASKCFPKGWDVKRDRRLEPGEHLRILARLRSIPAESRHHWQYLYRLALETGARLQELVLAEWSEIQLGGQVWTIPAAHTKTNETRTVSLSPKARRIMWLLHHRPSRDANTILGNLGGCASVSAGFHKYMKKAGIVDLRFHDLRHEAISRMVLYKKKAGIGPIMKMVGHAKHQTVARYANLRPHEFIGLLD